MENKKATHMKINADTENGKFKPETDLNRLIKIMIQNDLNIEKSKD